MANFKPFNDYTIFLLSKFIDKYNLMPPFLDVGCGTGDLSSYLARRGWSGKAVDFSDKAIKIAKNKLKKFEKINVEKGDFMREKNKYNSVLLWDVLEHIKEDNLALKKINKILNIGGYIAISSPSNPKEWSWDDDYYGHYRRYTKRSITKKLNSTGFKTLKVWDTTYPVFWAIRRLYLTIKSKPDVGGEEKIERTKESGIEPAWDMPYVKSFMKLTNYVWYPVYLTQYLFFKNHTKQGFSLIVVAKKVKSI